MFDEWIITRNQTEHGDLFGVRHEGHEINLCGPIGPQYPQLFAQVNLKFGIPFYISFWRTSDGKHTHIRKVFPKATFDKSIVYLTEGDLVAIKLASDMHLL